MIAKAKAISHGINAIRYMSGESEHKKHPEKIYHVCDQNLDADMDALGIWMMMNLISASRMDVKNNVIRIEISPSAEYTKDFSLSDWKKLWNDFIEEFDKQVIYDKKGKLVSDKTHLGCSMATVWLHKDSESGTPHLHAAVSRMTEWGQMNNDHAIHLRAQRAAEIIARRYGWTTACEIRDNNLRKVSEDCMDIVRLMPHWSWDEYAYLLKRKGYDVRLRRDKEGIVRGYVLAKGNAKYKASELGCGRKLTAKNIETTWKLLHPQMRNVSASINNPVQKPQKSISAGFKVDGSGIGTAGNTKAKFVDDTYSRAFNSYTERVPGTSRVSINIDGEVYDRFIPKEIEDYFDTEFDFRSVANWKMLTNLATAYFTMLATPNISVSGGGGSTGNDQKWGRDPREDEMEWAHRCAQAAIAALGKRARYGRRR